MVQRFKPVAHTQAKDGERDRLGGATIHLSSTNFHLKVFAGVNCVFLASFWRMMVLLVVIYKLRFISLNYV